MKDYSLQYNSYSIFLREKSDERFKQRLDSIRARKNNFLPNIKRNQSPTNLKLSNLKTEGVLSPSKSLSLKDQGKKIII